MTDAPHPIDRPPAANTSDDETSAQRHEPGSDASPSGHRLGDSPRDRRPPADRGRPETATAADWTPTLTGFVEVALPDATGWCWPRCTAEIHFLPHAGLAAALGARPTPEEPALVEPRGLPAVISGPAFEACHLSVAHGRAPQRGELDISQAQELVDAGAACWVHFDGRRWHPAAAASARADAAVDDDPGHWPFTPSAWVSNPWTFGHTWLDVDDLERIIGIVRNRRRPTLRVHPGDAARAVRLLPGARRGAGAEGLTEIVLPSDNAGLGEDLLATEILMRWWLRRGLTPRLVCWFQAP